MTQHHHQLILKSLSGTATEEEQRQLTAWTELSPENKKELHDYQHLWNSKGTKPLPSFDSSEELKKLQFVLEQEQQGTKTFSLASSWWFKVAASLALLFIASFLLYRTMTKPAMLSRESGSEKIQFALPDGSHVWLNENSKVTYPSSFAGHERLVELSGEGFFEVTPDPAKPFVVRASKSEVKVLGTSFNVRAFDHETLDEVFVVTGKVSLSTTTEPHQPIILIPGEEGIVNKETHALARSTEANLNSAAWKNKKLVFKKTSLHDVAETLERYFEIKVTVKNPELQKCRFTSSFQDPTLDEVIEAISIALNLNVIHQNKNYTFDGEGC